MLEYVTVILFCHRLACSRHFNRKCSASLANQTKISGLIVTPRASADVWFIWRNVRSVQNGVKKIPPKCCVAMLLSVADWEYEQQLVRN